MTVSKFTKEVTSRDSKACPLGRCANPNPEHDALLIGLYGSAFLAAMVWFVDDAYPEVNSALLSFLWVTAAVGLVALSAAYLSGLVLLFQRPAWRRRLEWLAPVGRMALTNYLMQSVVLVALLNGQGLGLLGRVGTTGCVAWPHWPSMRC